MRAGSGSSTGESWQERERRREEAVRRARKLPREPSSARARLVLWLSLACWTGVLVWLALTLPERVPTHWSGSGVPDGWSSKAGALAMPVVFLAITLPLVLLSRLVFVAPDLVNAPHREWWTSTVPRVVRFERLVREDIMVITGLTLLLLVSAEVVIAYAAHQPGGAVPWWIFPVALVAYLTLLTLRVVRMYLGGRYRPDVQERALQDRDAT
ncbi:DUF1648 domain-containing protein [Ornithinimicrobium avium]|uniref:DUF1648 domain-containing protein n=1 Tax=Ornithinimicrobium avium TaxID=2283195 RepID=A0A345NQ91_9MICO|nr:DUF1648 domain-containing protein [Ornithinimicrobium avium]AXH97199.1 DUF1648 domain-containing protein [Ornithinimicrobium avium]